MSEDVACRCLASAGAEHDVALSPLLEGGVDWKPHDRTAASFLEVDTRVDPREVGIRTCAEIESLFARMNAVVTTQLHGLVLALRNGLPAVAIDPVRGGAKVPAQARAIGWPAAMALEEVAGHRRRARRRAGLLPDTRSGLASARVRGP